MTDQTKRCYVCGETKPLREFHKRGGGNLRGEITDQQLETDSAWNWFKKQSPAIELDAEILRRSDAEVAQWMQEAS